MLHSLCIDWLLDKKKTTAWIAVSNDGLTCDPGSSRVLGAADGRPTEWGHDVPPHRGRTWRVVMKARY